MSSNQISAIPSKLEAVNSGEKSKRGAGRFDQGIERCAMEIIGCPHMTMPLKELMLIEDMLPNGRVHYNAALDHYGQPCEEAARRGGQTRDALVPS
jgi:hypothetical protein